MSPREAQADHPRLAVPAERSAHAECPGRYATERHGHPSSARAGPPPVQTHSHSASRCNPVWILLSGFSFPDLQVLGIGCWVLGLLRVSPCPPWLSSSPRGSLLFPFPF